MIQPLNSSITAKFVPLQTVITPDFRLSPQKIDTFIKCYEILAKRENQLILCEIVSEREQKRARSYNYSFTPVPLRVSLSCMHKNTPKRCQETLIDTFLRFSPPVLRFFTTKFSESRKKKRGMRILWFSEEDAKWSRSVTSRWLPLHFCSFFLSELRFTTRDILW